MLQTAPTMYLLSENAQVSAGILARGLVRATASVRALFARPTTEVTLAA